MVEIRNLAPERWEEARQLRLQALKTDPIAFGSSYEEEENFPEQEWQRRMKNALYALTDDGKLVVGSITYVFSDRVKSKHIAKIFGVYVDPDYRGKGIGKKMLQAALDNIQKNKNIAKIQLFVNQEQVAAFNLYKNAGFKVVGQLGKEIKVRDRFYDELVMEKMLSP